MMSAEQAVSNEANADRRCGHCDVDYEASVVPLVSGPKYAIAMPKRKRKLSIVPTVSSGTLYWRTTALRISTAAAAIRPQLKQKPAPRLRMRVGNSSGK